jgi:hypothetical protein
MRPGVETGPLLKRRYKQALQPGEIVFSAWLTTVTFAVVHLCCSTPLFRYSNRLLALSFVLCFVVLCLALFLVAYRRRQRHEPYRSWLTAALFCSAAAVAGGVLGEKSWFQYSAFSFVYDKMASYVNIDPSVDKGRSYMDAGTVYFKEGSYVDSKSAIAFHNGLTYCVAPILRGNGSRPIGTDFWAIGVDCCGDNAEKFRCGDVSSKTRSGLRLLDDTSRAMYQLAVQEWSATAGLAVEHPIFFRWTQDPLTYREELHERGGSEFWWQTTMCFILAFIATFLVHILLRQARVQ